MLTSKLRKTLVTAIIAAFGMLLLPASASAQVAPSISTQQQIVATFRNTLDESVVLRRGFWSSANPNSGFGYEKIVGKHRITNLGVIRQILAHPDAVTPQGGGRYAHDSRSRRFVCRPGCVEVQSVVVRVVIDYHGWSGPGQFGVVTAYCLNPDKAWACPAYVNAAVNV